MLLLIGVGAGSLSVAQAATTVKAVDDAGADDEPGQKDLNWLSVTYADPGATTMSVQWGWDDTATSGANTRDAGALFDTDGDGFANYSLYVTVASDGSSETELYECVADNRTDRCAGPEPVSDFASDATASIVAGSDPFGVLASPDFDLSHVSGNTCDDRPGCYTDDTVADASIDLGDFGDPTAATLLNVCSYPSGQPNSDPSDCVFAPNAGFLTIVKVANPDDGTPFVFSASASSAGGPSSWTIEGSGSEPQISFAPTTTLDLAETVPSGWQLDSASCAIAGVSTGTAASSGVSDLEIRSGLETICTFTNTKLHPLLEVVKSSTTTSVSAAGQVVPYRFAVSNKGNVVLTGITVTDPKCDAAPVYVSGDTDTDNELDLSETWIYSCSHTVTQAELDAGGTLSNTVTADSNESGPDTDTLHIPITQSPTISLVKSASPLTYDSVGDVISYGYVVTNTGNVSLAGPVTVADDKATVVCPAGGLAPGASITCTASYTITQADLNNGSVTNVAKATVNGTESNEDTETVTGEQKTTLSLDKTASPLSTDSVGDVVSYSYVVKNTGNVRLAGPVTVADDKATVTCPALSSVGNGDSFLDPNESITCTASYSITQADLNAGSVTNTARASAGGVESNEDKVTVTAVAPPTPPALPAPPAPPALPVAPAPKAIDLSVVKTDRPDPVFVGAQLTYTLSVRNAGPDTATNVTVADSLPARTQFVSVRTSQGTCVGGPLVRCELGSIAPNGSVLVTIVVRALEAGALINSATVVGAEPEANTANNTSSTPTLVRGPFKPPVATCPTMTVQPRTLGLGKKGIVKVLVSKAGKGVQGVRILVSGPGLKKAATTDRRGRVGIAVRPPRAGIVTIRMANQPARCSTRRIGVVGVFLPPPVTG